jgi:hypothetical protein
VRCTATAESRLAEVDRLRAEVARLLELLRPRLASADDRAALAELARSGEELERLVRVLRPFVLENRDTEAFAFTGPGSPAAKAFDAVTLCARPARAGRAVTAAARTSPASPARARAPWLGP